MKPIFTLLFLAFVVSVSADPTVRQISSEDARSRQTEEPAVRIDDDKKRHSTRTPDKRQPVNESVVITDIPVFVEVDERRKIDREKEFPRRKLPKSKD